MARSLSVAVQQRTRLIGALLSATAVNLRNICSHYYGMRCICYVLESRRYQISSALCLHPAATELRGYSTGQAQPARTLKSWGAVTGRGGPQFVADSKFVSWKTGIVRTHLGRPGAEKEKIGAARSRGHRHRQDSQADRPVSARSTDSNARSGEMARKKQGVGSPPKGKFASRVAVGPKKTGPGVQRRSWPGPQSFVRLADAPYCHGFQGRDGAPGSQIAPDQRVEGRFYFTWLDMDTRIDRALTFSAVCRPIGRQTVSDKVAITPHVRLR